MQYVNITDFFNHFNPAHFSASVAELGPDAGTQTFNKALAFAHEHPAMLTETEMDEWQREVAGMGAWDETERAEWDHSQWLALFIQFAAGNIREAKLSPKSSADDWASYYARAEDGQVNGALFATDDGQVFNSVGT